MAKDDIKKLSNFLLESEIWVRIAINFISKHSKLTNKDLIFSIIEAVLKSNCTFSMIFEFCLEVYQIDKDIDFDSGFFEIIQQLANSGRFSIGYIENLSNAGLNGAKAGKELRKVLEKLNKN